MSDLTPFARRNVAVTSDSPPCDPDEFLIVREDFAGGAFNAYWNFPTILESVYSPNTAQVPFPTAASLGLTPPSGNEYVGNYFYKLGQPSDNTVFQMQRSGEGLDIQELYVRWHEYYTPGFMWPQSQKFIRIGNGSGIGPTVDLVPIAVNGVENHFLTLLGYDSSPPEGVTFGGSNFPMDDFLPTGEWISMEFYFKKASAPDVADGRAWARINGVAFDRGLVVTHTTDDKPFNYMWLGGNNTWNGEGPGGYTTVPQDQNRYLDEPEWFSGLPCDVTPP